ncbi:MAG: Adenine permease AdeQ [Chlamydiia bacterium]|nr:Adenine permease AdeQ [Chlamydiia bacterium]
MERMARFYKVRENGSTFRNEIVAGFTTFSSMAYVVIVNPLILSFANMDEGAVMVATILSTLIATLLMSLFVNSPIAIAPGMGVSTFLVFSLIGKGLLSWQEALAAVFIAGAILLVLNLFRLRARFLHAIPPSLMKGAIGGIGLFLITVGLRELGIIIPHINGMISIGAPLPGPTLLALMGLLVTIYLLKKEFQSAFLLGIGLIWIVSLATHMSEWKGVFSLPPSLMPTLGKLDFSAIFTLRFLRALFALYLVTLFDSSTALLTLYRFLGFSESNKELTKALYADAIGTMGGAFFGTGSLAIHLESASGIRVGGRTGVTSLIVAICFALTLFIYPVISSIPPFASSPILVLIGVMMLKELRGIAFNDITEWLPPFLMLIVMPLFFSIFLGFVVGFIAHLLIKILSGKGKELSWFTWVIAMLLGLFEGMNRFS